MTVAINGVAQSLTATPGATSPSTGPGRAGDVVDVTMGAALTFPRANDNANVGAVKYGAILYAGEYGTTDLGGTLPTLQTASVTAAGTLHFTGTASTGAVSLIPFYKMHHQRYTVYWNLAGSPPDGSSYEAESATLAGQAAVRSSAGASGGALVGYVGNGTANYLRFGNVSATRAGSHTVTIYYAAGEARSVTLTVNGAAGPTVSTPSTGGWDTVGSVGVAVTLVARHQHRPARQRHRLGPRPRPHRRELRDPDETKTDPGRRVRSRRRGAAGRPRRGRGRVHQHRRQRRLHERAQQRADQRACN